MSPQSPKHQLNSKRDVAIRTDIVACCLSDSLFCQAITGLLLRRVSVLDHRSLFDSGFLAEGSALVRAYGLHRSA